MGAIGSQITSLTIVFSTVYSGADQRRHDSSASLAFLRGIHRGPVNFPHKWPVTRKMFPLDDVIMTFQHDGRSLGSRFGIKYWIATFIWFTSTTKFRVSLYEIYHNLLYQARFLYTKCHIYSSLWQVQLKQQFCWYIQKFVMEIRCWKSGLDPYETVTFWSPHCIW